MNISEFISFSLLDWLMLGGLAAVFLYQLYFYIRYMAGVQRRVRHQSKGRFRWNVKKQARKAQKAAEKAAQEAEAARQAAIEAAEKAGLELAEPETATTPQPHPQNPAEKPGVSVVVCARNEGDNLQHYLHSLVCQNYPTFEVIVVNDASEDNTQLVLDHYQKNFRNLHITFVPADAMVRSSKKLALTLAAKASHYDYLLLTDADCRPESPDWITEMMAGFCQPETEIVLGYGGYFEEPYRVNRLIQYDTVFCAMQYLGMAMSGHPYMGVGRNLAYRKDTFFRNRGFAGQLGQRAGDDDLFVNKVCNAANTEVVLTPKSYTWSVPKRTFEQWRIQKYRHLSVSPSYKLASKLRLGFEPLTRGLWYALLIAAVVLAILGLVSPVTAFVGAALFIARLVWQMGMMNRAGHIFGMSGFGIEVLWFDIFLPLNNLFMLIRHRLHRHQQLQW